MTNLVKGVLRAIVRIAIEIIHRSILHLPDTLFGFLSWPGKKLRIKVFLLQDPQKNLAIVPEDLNTAINHAVKVFKKEFNVLIVPVRSNEPFTEKLKNTPPYAALNTKGGPGALSEEFKIAGNFYASNLRAPVYPITVFVVASIQGATGCSLGPMTDYVTLDQDAAKDHSILAHELAHACGLWHLQDKENLLWHTKARGDKISWWQKNIFRGSRHVTYW